MILGAASYLVDVSGGGAEVSVSVRWHFFRDPKHVASLYGFLKVHGVRVSGGGDS